MVYFYLSFGQLFFCSFKPVCHNNRLGRFLPRCLYEQYLNVQFTSSNKLAYSQSTTIYFCNSLYYCVAYMYCDYLGIFETKQFHGKRLGEEFRVLMNPIVLFALYLSWFFLTLNQFASNASGTCVETVSRIKLIQRAFFVKNASTSGTLFRFLFFLDLCLRIPLNQFCCSFTGR